MTTPGTTRTPAQKVANQISAKARAAERKARGDCANCGTRPAATDRKYCRKCLRKHAARSARYRDLQRSLNPNWKCRQPHHKRSVESIIRGVVSKREAYYDLKATGYCVRCAHEKARRGRVTCKSCGAKAVADTDKHRTRKAAKHPTKCVTCIKRARTEGQKTCAKCRARAAENARVQRAWKRLEPAA